MNCLPLVLYLISLLDSAFTSLPAPVNVSMHSVNFHHVLRWDPGPGTPPGTQYKIFSVTKKGQQKQLSKSPTTSVKLELKNNGRYNLTVRASYNQTLSPESHRVAFKPIRDTIIGRPELSLAGCDNCININISLPEADRSSGIDDLDTFYVAQFNVTVKTPNGQVENFTTEYRSFILISLQHGTEYCIQVKAVLDLNKNIQPSDWKCTFTSTVEPGRVLTSLPAPVNVSMRSVNFHHVLRWDPGPGTPPGTQYKIFRVLTKKLWKLLSISTTTSVKLELENYITYTLTVQASYNQTLSPESHKVAFLPISNTIIGRPELSLAGCGNCINVNISLPEADRSSGIDDIYDFYSSEFIVSWKKREGAVETITEQNRSFPLRYLEVGTEYCVQVHMKISLNENTEPSDWKCTFTSIVEPSRGLLVFGMAAALLIVVAIGLMCSMFLLYYTGFICKLKTTLPQALIMFLRRDYTLTPETTTMDQIFISPEKQKRRNNPSTQQTATRRAESEDEDEAEEEEEEGINVYVNRPTDLSSDKSSCGDSGNMSGNRTLASSGDSGSLTVETEVPVAEFEFAHEGLDQAEADGAEVSFIPERSQTGVQGHVSGEVEEEAEEEVCDSSGNVNLFSVTLASLAVYEGEEEEEEEQNTRDSLADFLKLSDLEPLLDSQTGSDDHTTVAIMLPTQEDLTAAEYEGRVTDILSGCLKTCDGETQHEHTQEEEEEEEFSGYMRHT